MLQTQLYRRLPSHSPSLTLTRSLLQGLQWIQENWYTLITRILPFTSQMEAKDTFTSNQRIMGGLGWLVAFVSLTALYRSWKHLGGTAVLVQTRWGLLGPQLALCGGLSIAGVVMTIRSALLLQPVPWANTISLVALFGNLFSVTTHALSVAMAARWGNHHVVYSITVLCMLLAWLVNMGAAIACLVGANEVSSWVSDHWNDLLPVVGPDFAGATAARYGEAGALRMRLAGTCTVLLASLQFILIISSLRAALVLLALGPSVYHQDVMPLPLCGWRSAGQEHRVVLRNRHASETHVPPQSGRYAHIEEDDTALSTPAGVSERPALSGGFPDEFNGVATPQIGPKPVSPSEVSTVDQAMQDEAELSRAALNRRTGASYGSTLHSATAQSDPGYEHAAVPVSPDVVSQSQWHVPATRAIAHESSHVHKLNDDIPSLGSWWQSTKEGTLHLGQQQRCVMLSLFGMVLSMLGLSLIVVATLSQASACASVTTRGVNVAWDMQVPMGHWPKYNFVNEFPQAALIISRVDGEQNKNASVRIVVWSESAEVLPTADRLRASVATNETAAEILQVVLTPGSLGIAEPGCAAVALYITLPLANDADLANSQLTATTTNGLLFMEGMSFYMGFAPFASVLLKSGAGPIVLKDLYSSSFFSVDQAALVIESDTGDVTVNDLVATSPSITTAGDISVQGVISWSTGLGTVGVHGDVNITAKGDGVITMTGAAGARSLFLATERGHIIADTVGAGIMRDVWVQSEEGSIWLTSWLQLYGNHTYVRTPGYFTASALYANVLDVEAHAGAAITEVFMGLQATHNSLLPDMLPGNYTQPALRVSSKLSGIKLLGLGANSADATWAMNMHTDIVTERGDVRVQVNGGGYTGPYRARTGDGVVTVEIAGQEASAEGSLGDNPEATGLLNVYTAAGDISFAALSSPLAGVSVANLLK